MEVGAYGVRGNHDDLALHALQYPNTRRRKSTMSWLDKFEPEQVCTDAAVCHCPGLMTYLAPCKPLCAGARRMTTPGWVAIQVVTSGCSILADYASYIVTWYSEQVM